MLLCKTKNLRICVCKNTVTAESLCYMHRQKNLPVCGSAQTKNLCKKAEIFMFGIFLHRQNYEEKTL